MENEIVLNTVDTAKAKVLEVEESSNKPVPGTTVMGIYQKLQVAILDGPEKGKKIEIENDYIKLEKGEVFYLTHTRNSLENLDLYSVSEPYRLNSLILFFVLFLAVVIYFGRKQGIRGLISLAGSLILILFVLLPSIIGGSSPVLLCLLVAGVIVTLGSFVTHGFNKTTLSAVLGMLATLIFTGLLSLLAIHLTRLTGAGTEEAVYLNFDTRGTLNFSGLLLGGIIIGLLGVLYDAAIGQAVAVEELQNAGAHLTRKEVYTRALRIGREHIGALVNTLAIAYVGASLPLLLLLYNSNSLPIHALINKEIFASEIIRTIIGSIGIVLAVPITTAIATLLLRERSDSSRTI